jgi:hypothetical protein
MMKLHDGAGFGGAGGNDRVAGESTPGIKSTANSITICAHVWLAQGVTGGKGVPKAAAR